MTAGPRPGERADGSDGIALAVHAEVPELGQRWDLELPEGSVTAVVGPNGSGKSSLLRCITGQLRPARGTVEIGGAIVAGPGRQVPVHRREAALLEQRPLLFPHLEVLDNVAFGLQARGVRRGPARARAAEGLAAVGCADLAARRAHQLSGGQAQRIALARALVTDPRLLLLDEPMAALDVAVAPSVRAVLRTVLAGAGRRTALLVTHDLLDVLALADRVALVEAGRVVASGEVADMLSRPGTPFLADLVGVNLLAGTATAPDAIAPAVGAPRLVGIAPDRPLTVGRPAFATFPPAAVSVHLDDPGGSPRNHLAATVTGLEPRGGIVRLTTRLAGSAALPSEDAGAGPAAYGTVSADVTAAAAVELDLRLGLDVRLAVKATQVTLYERGGRATP